MIGQNIYNRMSEQADWVGGESREMVDHYPISTALVAFGLGLGAGIALVSLLTEEETHYQASSNYAQKLGRQMMDAMAHVMPDAVTKKMWG